MIKLFKNSHWLVGGLIFFMPILLILFLASQMAYSQVNGKFETYQNIPQVSELAALETLSAGQVVMVRGRISAAAAPPFDEKTNLVVFQERPADGREVRYREEFPLVFPKFDLDLPDGTLTIIPSPSRDLVIQRELHKTLKDDREYTGFRQGDTVTVQGEWQPESQRLDEVTGITSLDKADLMADWQAGFRKVRWARNGLGGLTVVSLILLFIQWRRTRSKEKDSWPIQETPITPTT